MLGMGGEGETNKVGRRICEMRGENGIFRLEIENPC